MIYEMVQQCFDTLHDAWVNLEAELTRLRDAASTADRTHLASTVDGMISVIHTHALGLNGYDASADSNGFLTITPMLANARTQLNASRNLQYPTRAAPLGSLITSLTSTLDRAINDTITTVAEAAAVANTQLLNLQEHIDSCLREIEELTTPEGANASIGGINRSVENISTYPVLTQEAGYISSPSSLAGGAAGTRPLNQIVESTLRDVLGWRPKTGDHKAFVAALTQSYTCSEVEGRTQCLYTPRTYAMQVNADLGAITGAQASIYSRAKVALEQSSSILARLYPLNADADDEDVEASRAIVRSLWTELVGELGMEGGPRVERVDSLFAQLLGAGNTSFDLELLPADSQLGQMRDNLGLTNSNVNTVVEEGNLTDFITLLHYVSSLNQSWIAQRRFFDRSNVAQPFLGTQLVLVSRALAVLSESVHEVYYAMDSVFLAAAERQTIELVFANRPPIFVAELLAWVDRFASEEAPLLIQDAGKAGVRALFPTVDTITTLVRDAQIPPQNPNRLPAAYRTSRVQRSLQELTTHLSATANLAREFLLP
jgi:hypothetical protein